MRERMNEAQFLPRDDQLLDFDRIDDPWTLRIRTVQWDRRLERCLHRTSARQGTPTIMDPGKKALLQGIGQMPVIRENATSAGVRHHLQRRLAIAIFEILPAQPVPVHS